MLESLASRRIFYRESNLLQCPAPVIVRPQYLDAGFLQGAEQTPLACRFVIDALPVVLAIPH
jgi:hypothetical protein